MSRGSIVFLLLSSFLAAQAPQGYYRSPAIHGERIVFLAEGDLWTVAADGGPAQRLTSHAGNESHPAISPDGSLLAFTASYEGPTEVYTMPLDGGLPTRRSYEGERAYVVGWTPAGELLYRTRFFSTLPDYQLVALDLSTGRKRRLPLAQAADGCFDEQGQLYFTRQSFQGSHTKRYRGGTVQNLWRFGADEREAAQLWPDFAGTSKDPMWWQGRLYCASDRDGTMNIWSMRPDGTDPRQHTHHSGWDVQDPQLQDGRIVYQLGADIHRLDLDDGSERTLNITLTSDFDQMRERWLDDPFPYLSAGHISYDGSWVALTARGEVCVVPREAGRLRQLTRASEVRYRDARFLPDGDLYVRSDASGEVEFWRLDADPETASVQLTQNAQVLRWEGVPSPDGRWLAHHDKNYQLWLTDLLSGEEQLLETSDYGWREAYWGLRWSPDSRWLAYSTPAPNTYDQVVIRNIEDGRRIALTSERMQSASPAWSPDGQWIYFLSDRHLRSSVASPWGFLQPEPHYQDKTGIYCLPLAADLLSPFEPDDELSAEPVESGAPADSSEAELRVEVLLEGLDWRVQSVPVGPGSYSNLMANAERLFWEAETDQGRTLMALDIAAGAEPLALVEGIDAAQLSGDGAWLLVKQGNALAILPAGSGAGAAFADHQLELQDWSFSVQPAEEWRQMFVDAWRLERDYFYDPGMHGVDWPAMRRKYEPLVERVRNRDELANLLAQMVGELSALHTFVYGGDHRTGPDDVGVAALGARLERDAAAGGYRIAKIYRADPDQLDLRSPLLKPGLGIEMGDVIVRINGRDTLEEADVGALLRRQAGRQLRLRLARGDAQRDVIVRALSARAARDLRYRDWEYSRRLQVEELGAGQIGYLHLRAMGRANIDEWAQGFYPVFHRGGLILDVRHNNGGNIDSWILGKLMRRAWFYWHGRLGEPTWNMQYAFRGHLVVLCDADTASDGEAVSEGVRRLGLGTVIGTRTWGGEIWLSSSNRLVDQGIATAAEWGVYGPEGSWLIEGHGVVPDIEVDNLPHATFEGKDAQLEAAVAHLLRKLEEEPVEVPRPPPFPDKSGPE